MDENKIKRLEFLQNVIARLNSNSFQIKSWAITIVAALLALYVDSDSNTFYILIAIFPTILFWGSDAYCLRQERLFRCLYNDVAEITNIENRVTIIPFEMSIKKYTKGDCQYWRCFLSATIIGFYGLICIGLLIGYCLLQYPICRCCMC